LEFWAPEAQGFENFDLPETSGSASISELPMLESRSTVLAGSRRNLAAVEEEVARKLN